MAVTAEQIHFENELCMFFCPVTPSTRPSPVVNSISVVVAVVAVECKSGENIVNAHLKIRAHQARHKFTSVTVRFYWNM